MVCKVTRLTSAQFTIYVLGCRRDGTQRLRHCVALQTDVTDGMTAASTSRGYNSATSRCDVDGRHAADAARLPLQEQPRVYLCNNCMLTLVLRMATGDIVLPFKATHRGVKNGLTHRRSIDMLHHDQTAA